jgi:hypothetical protein
LWLGHDENHRTEDAAMMLYGGIDLRANNSLAAIPH